MKYNTAILIVFLAFFLTINIRAQDKGCEVALSSISGMYTGDCNKGKANGNGTSVGKDKYSGEFKAGLPDGKGIYEWANGDAFDGLWLKGYKEGRGIMTVKRPGKSDSILVGVWRKDIYTGNYDNPYTIYQKNMYISRIDLRKNKNGKDNSIVINAISASSGMSTLNGARVPPAGATVTTVTRPAGSPPPTSTSLPVSTTVINDITVSKGSYQQVIDGASTSRGVSKKLLEVEYPFKALYRINGQDIGIEISEPGEWTITIAMNN